MPPDPLAELLGDRVRAVASAAERTGVPGEAVERLLAAASVAALRAVALSLLTGETRGRPEIAVEPDRRLRDAA